MPSEKRARKRAAREAKLAAQAKAAQRRTTTRRVVTGAVIAAVVVGLVVLFNQGSAKKKASTSTSSTTSTTRPSTAQAKANQAAVAAGCPSNPSTPLTKTQWKTPPAMTIDPNRVYTATVVTDAGTFTMQLDPKQSAPAVNSFVFLAQHQFFNCVTFHRVIPAFVIQGGDPTGTGTGGPGYQFTAAAPPKAANPAQQYPLYSVAMANADNPPTTTPTTNGSQFYIVTGASGESLANNYVLFGKVVSGYPVIAQISADGSANGVPPTVTHRMLTVTVT